jgi:hypothetical protein
MSSITSLRNFESFGEIKIISAMIRLPKKFWKWVLDLFTAKDKKIRHLHRQVKHLKNEKGLLNGENQRLKVQLSQPLIIAPEKERESFTALLNTSEWEDPIFLGSISELEKSIDYSIQLDTREENLMSREEELIKKETELDKQRRKWERLFQNSIDKLKKDLENKQKRAEEETEDLEVAKAQAQEIDDLTNLVREQEKTIQSLQLQNLADLERKEEVQKLCLLRQEIKEERKSAFAERKKIDDSIKEGVRKYRQLVSSNSQNVD